jgi:hypothetical protein
MNHSYQGARAPRRVLLSTVHRAVLYASFAIFLGELVDSAGRPLTVAEHHELWCDLIATETRLVLLAPRDHGKTTLLLAYILWQFWRHTHDPVGRPLATPAGTYSAVLFSATRDQALVLMAKFRELLVANSALFGEVGPSASREGQRQQIRWSRTDVRLPGGAELLIRSYRGSSRGLHPDLLLLDDVLSDQNSLSSYQRERTLKYFVGTLMPMNPGQLVIVGTAFHQDDLFHRLRPGRATSRGDRAAAAFTWRRYFALDVDAHDALWPERHPYDELIDLRDFDPVAFSREYQNLPRDDASSMFPFELTQRAIDAGAGLVFGPSYRPAPGEFVVLAVDIAISEATAADYTVILVVAFDPTTKLRRVLAARRVKGLDLASQVDLICDLFKRYGATIGLVEDNGFQRWLLEALWKRPETRHGMFGHTTGLGKTDLRDGVPRLKLELQAGSWVMPSGDAEARRFARTWQTELAAFGVRDGRLAGVGEHDDTVIASWLIELAVRHVELHIALPPEVEIITGEDVGIMPVRISPDLDAADALFELQRFRLDPDADDW